MCTVSQDHEQVLRYPPVRGMMHNTFFWDQNHPEGGNDDSKSKVNSPEAGMAARLALYMVQQGYAAGEVTILTPYVGQLRLIIRELSKLIDVVVGDSDADQLAVLVSLSWLRVFACECDTIARREVRPRCNLCVPDWRHCTYTCNMWCMHICGAVHLSKAATLSVCMLHYHSRLIAHPHET